MDRSRLIVVLIACSVDDDTVIHCPKLWLINYTTIHSTYCITNKTRFMPIYVVTTALTWALRRPQFKGNARLLFMSNTSYWKASIYTRGGNALPSKKDLVREWHGIETEIYDIQGEKDKVHLAVLFRPYCHNSPLIYCTTYSAVCDISGETSWQGNYICCYTPGWRHCKTWIGLLDLYTYSPDHCHAFAFESVIISW